MENGERIHPIEPLHSSVSKEILEMAKIDQEIRATKFNEKRWVEVEGANTKKMKQIVKEIGWPTISKVGEEASENAWLLVQHADRDVAFQKECLELMKKLSPEEVSEQNITYLYDRICVNEGKPQFFGTQFYDNEHGAYGPRPIEDIEHVDERRKTIGLEPLAEYKEGLIKKYRK